MKTVAYTLAVWILLTTNTKLVLVLALMVENKMTDNSIKSDYRRRGEDAKVVRRRGRSKMHEYGNAPQKA